MKTCENIAIDHPKKVLIAYSSINGCTEEIALNIRDHLDMYSIRADLVKINENGRLKALLGQDLTVYSGFILGSSIIVGKPHKQVLKLLKGLETMQGKEARFGFFISCMKARDPVHALEAKETYLDPVLARHDLHFTLVDAFGGVLDFSHGSPIKGMMRGILKKIMLKKNPDIKEIEPRVYDFRNWQQVHDFSSRWVSITMNGKELTEANSKRDGETP